MAQSMSCLSFVGRFWVTPEDAHLRALKGISLGLRPRRLRPVPTYCRARLRHQQSAGARTEDTRVRGAVILLPGSQPGGRGG